MSKTITFEEWCLQKGRNDLLGLWDYELNDILPSEIVKSAAQEMYFKCQNGIHEPSLVPVRNVAHLKEGSYPCKKCNSIG